MAWGLAGHSWEGLFWGMWELFQAVATPQGVKVRE